MTLTMSRPHLLDARVRRRSCDEAIHGRTPAHDGSEPAWALHVRYRRPEPGAPEARAVLPLTDEFSAFQIDLYLRAAQRGERTAARLLFAALHEEWGRRRLAHRDLAWDALFTFLAPLAVDPARAEPAAA